MWTCKCENVNPNSTNICLKCKSSIASSNITRSSTSASNGNSQCHTHHDTCFNHEPIMESILNNSGFYSEPSRGYGYSSSSDSNSSSSYDSSSSSSDSSSSCSE